MFHPFVGVALFIAFGGYFHLVDQEAKNHVAFRKVEKMLKQDPDFAEQFGELYGRYGMAWKRLSQGHGGDLSVSFKAAKQNGTVSFSAHKVQGSDRFMTGEIGNWVVDRINVAPDAGQELTLEYPKLSFDYTEAEMKQLGRETLEEFDLKSLATDYRVWVPIACMGLAFYFKLIPNFKPVSNKFGSALELARARAMSHSGIAKRCGMPLTIGTKGEGTADQQFVDFSFPVSGSMSKGMVFVQATKQKDAAVEWHFHRLVFQEDGVDNEISLTGDGEAKPLTTPPVRK